MFMTTAGFIILILLGLLGLWLFVEIGGFPGKKAKERNHPQAEAINVLGWLGLLFGGVGWVVAVVRGSRYRPSGAPTRVASTKSRSRRRSSSC